MAEDRCMEDGAKGRIQVGINSPMLGVACRRKAMIELRCPSLDVSLYQIQHI
jgi:hypothetical protein